MTLDGTVPSLAEKWRAARLVGTFKGVTALTNGVVVRPPARPDEDVAKAVKEALELDPATRNATVDATSSAGTVTIRGSADVGPQRELLAEVASRVPGVREVDTLGGGRLARRHPRRRGGRGRREREASRRRAPGRNARRRRGGRAARRPVGRRREPRATRGGGAGHRSPGWRRSNSARCASTGWRTSARSGAQRAPPSDAHLVGRRAVASSGERSPASELSSCPACAPNRGSSRSRATSMISGPKTSRRSRARHTSERRVAGRGPHNRGPRKHRRSDATTEAQVLRGIYEDLTARDSPDVRATTWRTGGSRSRE